MNAIALLIARNWKLVATATIFAVVIAYASIQRHNAQVWKGRAADEKSAHEITVANYRAAAKQAELADARNALRVKEEQAKITERVTDEYQGRIADADARYERLRAQAATYSRSAPSADPSEARDATCRAYAGTRCENIPPLLKAAQDNTDQLIALQAWVRAQAAVDFQGSAQ